MQLSILDRIRLLELLPERGNLVSLRLVKGLIDKIGFSDAEIAEYEIKHGDGQVTWGSNAKPIDVEFGLAEREFIAGLFSALDEKKDLSLEQLGLYEKFIGGPDAV